MKGTVLVTGGAGYIGSHTCVELLNAGCRVIVVDDLRNSSAESLKRVQAIAGRPAEFLEFHKVDLLDRASLQSIFGRQKVDAVIHFAGLKAVGESVEMPLHYYHNNITGTLYLLECMKEANVRRLVFSSSATVYGGATEAPFREDLPLEATNPYGRTKLFIEEICRDLAIAEKDWKIVLLRYFNPAGAHESGTIGEDPKGIPNNLMPYIMQVAVGLRPLLRIFGNDYPTPDGTCIRDYIHVVDLARGHLAALDSLDRIDGCDAINLGTGRGYSVLEVVKAVSSVLGKEIPYELAPRRPGDSPVSYGDVNRAKEILGWQAMLGIEEMCRDSWRWQSQNPSGFGK